MKRFIFFVIFVFIHSLISAQATNDTITKMMNTQKIISLKLAKQIAETAENMAIENKWNISVAIVNEAGQIIYFMKMDESTNASGDIAIAKARHAAYYRRDTKFHQDLLTKGNNVVLGLPNAMPIEGGIQLIYKGKTIGAIGVSGAASEDDGKMAKAGADILRDIKE